MQSSTTTYSKWLICFAALLSPLQAMQGVQAFCSHDGVSAFAANAYGEGVFGCGCGCFLGRGDGGILPSNGGKIAVSLPATPTNHLPTCWCQRVGSQALPCSPGRRFDSAKHALATLDSARLTLPAKTSRVSSPPAAPTCSAAETRIHLCRFLI